MGSEGRILAQGSPVDFGGKKLKILVVDDELFVRLMAVDALSDAGWDTVEAANADEAVELLEHCDDIDILFTDIRMPGSMDGLALAALVRDRWPDLRVIVTSGHITSPEIDPSTPFLSKPYRTNALTDRIAEVAR